MAAFSLVAVEGVVLLTCVEWWRTAHSVVIRVDQAHLKHESRPRSRNSQLGPQGTPTALYLYHAMELELYERPLVCARLISKRRASIPILFFR